MAKSAKANNSFDFTGIIPEKKPNTQHTHDTQHTPNAPKEQNTQRKQKHPRINMAFYGDNLEYVQEAAYQNRMSVTEYVNQLILEDKNRNLK